MDSATIASDSRVYVIKIQLCGYCLNGEGRECHTAGCALFLHRPPDFPITRELYDVIQAYPMDPEEEEEAAVRRKILVYYDDLINLLRTMWDDAPPVDGKTRDEWVAEEVEEMSAEDSDESSPITAERGNNHEGEL